MLLVVEQCIKINKSINKILHIYNYVFLSTRITDMIT